MLNSSQYRQHIRTTAQRLPRYQYSDSNMSLCKVFKLLMTLLPLHVDAVSPWHCCPQTWQGLNLSFHLRQLSTECCSTVRWAASEQRREGASALSALIQADSGRWGVDWGECTKNAFDRVKNESKVKHSSIRQNKITANLPKRRKKTQLNSHSVLTNNCCIHFLEGKG